MVSTVQDFNKQKKLNVDSISGTPTVDKATPVLLKGETVYDVSTLNFTQNQVLNSAVTAFEWNDNGTKLFGVNPDNNTVEEYDVSTAYDISTASFTQSKDISSEEDVATGIAWNNDGTKLYIVGRGGENVYEYDVSTAYDISTASFTQSKSLSSQDDRPYAALWNNNGTKFYFISSDNGIIYEYNASTAFDVSSLSFNQSKDVSSEDSSFGGLAWNDDGKKLFVGGDGNNSIHEYKTSTAYDISTASFTQSKDISGSVLNVDGFAWNDDGTKAFVTDSANSDINQYDGDELKESQTGTGYIIVDFTNISDAQDIAIYDQNDNLLDYEIEKLDTTAETAVIWCYNSWVRDGTTQAKVVYGANSDNTDNSVAGAGSNPWSNGQNAVIVQHLNESNYPTDTALDSTANDNDGSVTGATSTTGEFDGGGDFDGVDDNINIPNDASFSGDSSYTSVAWVNSDVADASFHKIAGSAKGGISNYKLYQTDSNNWGFRVADSTDSTAFPESTFSVSTDTDFHLVGRWDNSSFTAEIAVDGTQENSASTSNSIGSSTDDFRIGNDGAGQEFDGIIDEVRVYTDVKSDDWIQADYDASPKAGQVFFSQQAAESTTTGQTVALPETVSTGTTPNPQVTPGNVNISAPVTQATGATPNPAVFSDLFVSIPVSQGDSQSPTPTVVAGNTDIALQESIGTGVTPNPAVTVGNTIRLTPSTGTGSTPNPSVKGGVINLAVPSSTGTGSTPNPEILFDQVISAKVSQGIGNTPEPQVTGEAVTITMPVTTADSDTPNPTVSIEIVPRDSSTLSSIKRDQSKTLSGDINK